MKYKLVDEMVEGSCTGCVFHYGSIFDCIEADLDCDDKIIVEDTEDD